MFLELLWWRQLHGLWCSISTMYFQVFSKHWVSIFRIHVYCLWPEIYPKCIIIVSLLQDLTIKSIFYHIYSFGVNVFGLWNHNFHHYLTLCVECFVRKYSSFFLLHVWRPGSNSYMYILQIYLNVITNLICLSFVFSSILNTNKIYIFYIKHNILKTYFLVN